MTLDFLNKNMYRKYPLKSTCDMQFIDGNTMPSALITSMQISTVYSKHQLFVSKIFTSPGFISVTINNVTDGAAVGCFAGKCLTDFSVLPLTPFIPALSGSMTIGTLSSLVATPGFHLFRDETADLGSRSNALIEDSTIFCFIPPGVTAINKRNKRITGNTLTATLSPLAQNLSGSTAVSLSVTNIASILSNNEFTAGLSNCPTPVIKKINTVFPDSSGNIDIYGITPVVINIASGELAFDTVLDIIDVCPETNKIAPPVDNTNDYHAALSTNPEAEWRSWPRFS